MGSVGPITPFDGPEAGMVRRVGPVPVKEFDLTLNRAR
jgi:hypothetical protein